MDAVGRAKARPRAMGVIALVVCLSRPVLAQERPVAWTGQVSSTAPAVQGGTVALKLSAKVKTGWHLYSITQGPGGPIPTKIDLDAGQPFTLAGTVRGPAPVKRLDQNFGIEVEMYDGPVVFAVPVHVARDAQPGAAEVVVTARYQACNANLCMPPYTEKVRVPITVAR